MNTRNYIVILGGRSGADGATIRVAAPNKAEAKKSAKAAVPAFRLGGAMVYTLVSVYREEEMLHTWDELVRRNRGIHVDLTK